jgi:hypothetical protein
MMVEETLNSVNKPKVSEMCITKWCFVMLEVLSYATVKCQHVFFFSE